MRQTLVRAGVRSGWRRSFRPGCARKKSRRRPFRCLRGPWAGQVAAKLEWPSGRRAGTVPISAVIVSNASRISRSRCRPEFTRASSRSTSAAWAACRESRSYSRTTKHLVRVASFVHITRWNQPGRVHENDAGATTFRTSLFVDVGRRGRAATSVSTVRAAVAICLARSAATAGVAPRTDDPRKGAAPTGQPNHQGFVSRPSTGSYRACGAATRARPALHTLGLDHLVRAWPERTAANAGQAMPGARTPCQPLPWDTDGSGAGSVTLVPETSSKPASGTGPASRWSLPTPCENKNASCIAPPPMDSCAPARMCVRGERTKAPRRAGAATVHRSRRSE